ncbi:conserved hypothetical protein [Dickeya chrysanthemi Ech1591]|uniref:SnoaL-like domain-containing protein n=1 Tax=Dickeya chrysanthemi (strain Ech1591) TaxID=561229 RepID=C6CLG1_DICC1|nr:nuclear transport factor 2 family protein [Dickeya chrysanthemi]ACT08464.1 conserved hypothetical protein [Dickeya chrysanthemi Ech1591]
MSSEYEGRVRLVCEKFRTLDMNKIETCFTDDVIVHYNQLAPIYGKNMLLDFLTPRYRLLMDYQLEKQIIVTEGNRVCVDVRAEYINKETGKRYKSKIFEILTFHGEAISQWDYVGHSEEIIS